MTLFKALAIWSLPRSINKAAFVAKLRVGQPEIGSPGHPVFGLTEVLRLGQVEHEVGGVGDSLNFEFLDLFLVLLLSVTCSRLLVRISLVVTMVILLVWICEFFYYVFS